jgi:hypothetical protein
MRAKLGGAEIAYNRATTFGEQQQTRYPRRAEHSTEHARSLVRSPQQESQLVRLREDRWVQLREEVTQRQPDVVVCAARSKSEKKGERRNETRVRNAKKREAAKHVRRTVAKRERRGQTAANGLC